MTLVDRICPKCSFNQPRRMPRESWIARKIMPMFGCYPWECPMCRSQFYRKNRIDQDQRAMPISTQFSSQELSQ